MYILKHSKSGKPKAKILFCDVNLTKLYWKPVGSKPDPDMDNTEEDRILHPELYSVTAAMAGMGARNISRSCASSTDPSRASLFRSSSRSALDAPILLADAAAVAAQREERLDTIKARRKTRTGRMSLTKSDTDRIIYLKEISEVRNACHLFLLSRA